MHRIIRSRRKSLALIVERDGSLTVRSPFSVSRAEIDRFIEQHTDWIREKQARARKVYLPPHRYEDGEIFFFLGKQYPLKIVTRAAVQLRFEDTFYLDKKAQPRAGKIFTEWYRKQAYHLISNRLIKFSDKLDLHYEKIRITSARTRWGSCSSRGVLSFPWRLVMAPAEVIDYVVVHELIHLRFPNHSKDFWRQVEIIVPDFAQHRAWLHSHAKALVL